MSDRAGVQEISAERRPGLAKRIAAFIGLCFLPIILAGSLVKLVCSLALDNDTYTHIPLIPVVSIFLIFTNRKAILARSSNRWRFGAVVFLVGIVAVTVARYNALHLSEANTISLVMFGAVASWIGGFGIVFGTQALRAAMFPLLFLFFMVPVPEPLLSETVHFLQVGSATSTAFIFGLFGIPYLQQGLIFNLPGIAIRVAEECSGIRSTLALLIMTVLASHLFLKSGYQRLIVCLLVIPLSIFKNGIRIATLSALAVYVDPIFLTGPIHHKFGGMIFFGFAFVPLGLLFYLFRRIEVAHRHLPFNRASA
jgi:exosortase